MSKPTSITATQREMHGGGSGSIPPQHGSRNSRMTIAINDQEPGTTNTLLPSNPDEIIFHQDYRVFMENLRKGSVDLLLTDPPYIISRDTGFAKVKGGVKRFAVSMDFGQWDKQAIDLQVLCDEAHRALRVGGTAIIWYDIWKITYLQLAMERAGFKMIRLLIWQKTNPVPLNQKATYLSNSREIAVVGVKGGKPVFNGKYHNGIYQRPIPRHNGRRIHPTQKPLNLFGDLIAMHSDPHALVIDPFLGSGTTAIAALQSGRRFLGSEIDPDYVRAAKERVRGA